MIIISLYLQVERQRMKNIVVGRGLSSPLYILFSLFDIPLLTYFCQSDQAISEILRQGQYTIVIYHSTTVAGFRTIILLKWNSSTGIFLNFLIKSAEQLLCKENFFKWLLFLEHPLVTTCYCCSTLLIEH